MAMADMCWTHFYKVVEGLRPAMLPINFLQHHKDSRSIRTCRGRNYNTTNHIIASATA